MRGFFIDWFFTAFSHSSFPRELKMIIFDHYVGFKSRAILSFILVIFRMNKNEFLHGNLETVYVVLKDPGLSENMKNWREVRDIYNSEWISEKEYKSLFKAANIDYFQ